MYRTKIYVFACVYTIFSRFIQTETQFIHFASVCISEKGEGGERDLEEGRERNRNMCIYTIFYVLYNWKQFLYTCVCLKSKEASERLEESGERDIWERDA